MADNIAEVNEVVDAVAETPAQPIVLPKAKTKAAPEIDVNNTPLDKLTKEQLIQRCKNYEVALSECGDELDRLFKTYKKEIEKQKHIEAHINFAAKQIRDIADFLRIENM